MHGMFQQCNELEYLDLCNFNTSNITNIEYMFNGCNKLKDIKGLNQFITNEFIDMHGMFQQCYELEFIDLSNFNTSNVTNMECLFNGCNKLKDIKGLNKIFTNKVTTLSGIFQSCKELELIDISNFNTSMVINMGCLFNECSKLKKIEGINKLITKEVTDMQGLFQNCKELEYLDISNLLLMLQIWDICLMNVIN